MRSPPPPPLGRWPFGWLVDGDGTTAADAITEILSGVSLSWVIVDNAVEFRPWEWAAAIRSARSQAVTRRNLIKPVASRRLGYRKNWAPMARGDLAAIVFARDVVYEPGTRPADGATADFLLTPAGSTPPVIQANTAISVVIGGGWAATPGMKGPCEVSGLIAGNQVMIGLSAVATPGTPTDPPGSLLLAAYGVAGAWYTFDGSALRQSLGTGYSAATRWRVRYDGASLVVLANDVEVDRLAYASGGPLYGAATFKDAGSVSQITWDAFADVTALSQVTIDGPATVRIAADSAGVPLSDTTIGYKRLLGTTDVSASTTWSIATSSGCTVSVSTAGVVTRTGTLGQSGKFTLRSVRNAVTKDLAVSFVRDDATPPTSTGGGGGVGGGGGGTSGYGSVGSSTTVNTYGSAGSESAFTCQAGGGGQVALSISLNESLNRAFGGAASENGYAKLQWRAIGGTWADVAGTETVTDGLASWTPTDGSTDATITISATQTGLTNGTTYEFRCLFRRGATTSGTTASASGILSGVGG